MRYSIFPLAALLGSTLATPHNKHESLHWHHPPSGASGNGDHEPHETGKYPFLTGPAAPIVTGTAPLAHNTTTQYSTLYLTSTSRKIVYANDDHGTAAQPTESSPEMPQPLAQDKHAADEHGAAGQCGVAKTVTVPGKEVTVTVTAGAVAATSDSSSSDDENQPAQPGNSPSGSDDSKNQPSQPEKSRVQPVPLASSPAAVTALAPVQGGSDTTPSSSSSAPAQEQSAQTQTATGNAATQSQTSGTNSPSQQGGLPFKTKRGIIASGKSEDQVATAMGTGKVSWLGDW